MNVTKNNLDLTEDYISYVRPELGEKLKLLGLDLIFHKGEGKYLYTMVDGNEVKVLDLIGGYGASLFGQNHESLWECITEYQQSKIPDFVQMSVRHPATLLAKQLSDLLSNPVHDQYISTFVNSGAEAVEFAVKHAAYSKKVEMDHIQNEISSALSEIKHFFRHNKIVVSSEEFTDFEDYSSFSKYIKDFNSAAVSGFQPVMLSHKKSYHGKTIAALSLTDNPYYQSAISILPKLQVAECDESMDDILPFIHSERIELLVPKINAKKQIKIEKTTLSNIIGFILEPIKGEGGIRPLDISYLRQLSETLRYHGIPLIADEVQTGFFRCGHLSYLHSKGIFVDYVLLSKAMGGGLSKTGSCCISSRLFLPAMSMIHSSTFGEDELSCMISLKALELGKMYSDHIIHTSQTWLHTLQSLQKEFPQIIKEVRGEGFMIGIELFDFENDGSYAFQILSKSGYLGYMISSYLLHRHQIRITVTLSDPHTLRLHLNIFNDEEDVTNLVEGLKTVCTILSNRDLYCLTNHILPKEFQNLRQTSFYNLGKVPLETGEVDAEVAFIVHYISMETALTCEPSLSILPHEVISGLMTTISGLHQPAMLGKKIITNNTGTKTRVTFVGLPYTTEMIRNTLETTRNGIMSYREAINHAIDYCLTSGISTIGLGQFNSIIMRNGKDVIRDEALITTGNSLTIFAAYNVAKNDILKCGEGVSVAVLGAGGNIALTLSEMILAYSKKMYIIGSSENSKTKIEQHVSFLKTKNPVTEIIGGWDLSLIKEADIVLIATSASKAFLGASDFKKGSLVVDLSIPCNCFDSVKNDPDITFVNGGMIKLPQQETFNIGGIPLSKGMSYACLAETILMGMEGLTTSFSFGNIETEDVLQIGSIAEKHGFKTL